jgi:predicted nucleotidyltransferase
MAEMQQIRQRLQTRRTRHVSALRREAGRLAAAAAALGAQRVVLFGSLVTGEPGLASDVDLLVVWDTPLDFLDRTVELYRRLQPRVPVDLLVYTPREMETMVRRPFIRQALAEGKVLYGG